jgi:nitrogen-specific signal transduction histidine kinase
LDIARRIVESKHGGEIALRSNSQGTEFTVYLPIQGGETISEPASQQSAKSAQASAISS